jgi:hypothetical protein
MWTPDFLAYHAPIKPRMEQQLSDLPFLVHFCGGNERELISLFDEVKEGDWVFS